MHSSLLREVIVAGEETLHARLRQVVFGGTGSSGASESDSGSGVATGGGGWAD